MHATHRGLRVCGVAQVDSTRIARTCVRPAPCSDHRTLLHRYFLRKCLFTMMVRWKLEYFTLFFISVIELCRSHCPQDVQKATEKCLSGYYQRKKILEASDVKLYMGTDVETIRDICSRLKNAITCVDKIKDKCPDTEHPLIQAKLYDEMSMGQLCFHDRIYEKYAQYRNCFVKVSPSSQRCLHSYNLNAQVMIEHINSKDKNSQRELCTQYDTFITCLKTGIRVQCGNDAAQLVEVLARPEIKASDYCRNDTQSNSTKKPTGKPARHNAVTSTAGMSRTMTSSSLMYLVVAYLCTLYVSRSIH